jgi:3'-5' exonuclease
LKTTTSREPSRFKLSANSRGTIDLLASPIPPEVLEAIASCTLVGHNLDFDITVLRRYEITCSNSIVDTMLASRLLRLGKEKVRVSSEADLAPEDGMDVGEVINPIDHDLATVVRRYLGIKMDKAKTKLGRSDWGIPDLSPPHYHYMKADVTCLPALWGALQVELRGARLDEVFRERMIASVSCAARKWRIGTFVPFTTTVGCHSFGAVTMSKFAKHLRVDSG